MYFAVDHGLTDRRSGFRRDHGAELSAHSQKPVFQVAEHCAPNQRHLIDRGQEPTLFGVLHFQLVGRCLGLSGALVFKVEICRAIDLADEGKRRPGNVPLDNGGGIENVRDAPLWRLHGNRTARLNPGVYSCFGAAHNIRQLGPVDSLACNPWDSFL